MTDTGSGLGRNFSRDVEAILGIVQMGASLGDVYIYPHEVRQNLRRAGLSLDRKMPEIPEYGNPYEIPADHEPDFDPAMDDEEINDEEDSDD